MENEVKELLEDIKCELMDLLDVEWQKACESYDFDCDEDYAPYGDTYVSTGSYITDESESGFRQYFIEQNEPDELVQKLMLVPYVKKFLSDLVKEYAKNKEVSNG